MNIEIQIRPTYSKNQKGQYFHQSQIDGLVQERRNSIANALELRLSCTNPSKYRSIPSRNSDSLHAYTGCNNHYKNMTSLL